MNYQDVYHTERLCNHKHNTTKKQDLRHIYSHPLVPQNDFCFHLRDYQHNFSLVNHGWKDIQLNDTRFTYNLQVSPMVYGEYSDHYLLLMVLVLNINDLVKAEDVWSEYCYHNNLEYSILKWVESANKNVRYNKRKREYWRKNVRLVSLRLRYSRKPMLIQIRSYLGERIQQTIKVVTQRMKEALQTVAGLRFHLLGTKLSAYFE